MPAARANPDTASPRYRTLRSIVRQLRAAGFVCQGGPLENNLAFTALQRLAAKESRARRTR